HDVGMARKCVAIDFLVLERVRADENVAVGPCSRETIDLGEIVCENLIQIGDEATDIGRVPSGANHRLTLAARLASEAGVDQREVRVDEQIAAGGAIEQRAPARRREIETRASGEMKLIRSHRTGRVEGLEQPAAPEKIAGQDVGISAVADMR